MNQKLQLIDTVDAFKALERDWNALYEKSDKSTVFSSWDWMFTWWDVFSSEFSRKLFILCLYEGEQLVGVAPFQIYSRYPKSFIQGKTLQFVGGGNTKDANICTEYLDLMVLPGMETQMVNFVSDYLIEHKSKWDFADFEYLIEGALILQCFQSTNSKIARKEIEDGKRFYAPKVDSFEEYKALLKNRWRKTYDRKDRVINRDGEVIITSTDEGVSIESALELLGDMHCSRWKSKLGVCIFESPKFMDFHRKVMHRLGSRAEIKTIYKDDEALASYYIFKDKGQWHYYQSGFYSKRANRYSPLFLLICKEIGLASKQNQRFDFMYTDSSGDYKKEQYSATDTQIIYRLYWSTMPLRLTAFNASKAIQERLISVKAKVRKFIENQQKKSK